jgi:hypothetical protein
MLVAEAAVFGVALVEQVVRQLVALEVQPLAGSVHRQQTEGLVEVEVLMPTVEVEVEVVVLS